MNWRLPTGCSPGMCGWSCNCSASASSPARLGLASSQGPPPALLSLLPLPIKAAQAAELWCRRKTGAGAKSNGAKWRVGRHRGSTKSTPTPTWQHPLLPFPPTPHWEHGESCSAGDSGMPTCSLPVPSPGDAAGGRWGGRSISLLPALAAELGCSQHFYFKPHNMYEEARGVHGRASQPAGKRPGYPQPWKLRLLLPGLVHAQGRLGHLLFPLPSASWNWGSCSWCSLVKLSQSIWVAGSPEGLVTLPWPPPWHATSTCHDLCQRPSCKRGRLGRPGRAVQAGGFALWAAASPLSSCGRDKGPRCPMGLAGLGAGTEEPWDKASL